MPRTLLEFFADEAGDYLNKLDKALSVSGEPNADELRRLARALRGSARMADQDAIAQAAGAVQALAQDLMAGERQWSAELRDSVAWALGEIRQLVDSVERQPAGAAERMDAVIQRLGEWRPPAPPPPKDDERFRRYLGTELRGLASEIGDALGVLEHDPRNREPLKRLLRKIRPLRGIEGVDEIPPVGTALGAVEEVILRIADTSATVGPGHLALFRRTRQALENVATELIRGQAPEAATAAGVDIEDLKERVLETAAQREITWISDLFADDPGPHIVDCPMAEQGAGSWEAFFALEATGSLDTIDRLRAGLASEGGAPRRVGERLTYTFRQLRERAVTFGHAGLGRVARRAGAAVRAALEGPPWRLQSIAVDLATTLSALREYLEAPGDEPRREALARAEAALAVATRPSPTVVDVESLTYSVPDALERARQLSGELGGILQVARPDFVRARRLLEEALGLIEHAVAKTSAPQ